MTMMIDRRRIRQVFPFLLFLALTTLSFPSLALRVSGLYEAEVPVTSQQAGERAEAIRAGMRRVLVKLTGNRLAPTQDELISLVRNAEKYVQQYRYTETRPGDAGGTQSRLSLRIWFDESNLNTTLRNLGINIWGRERPSVLVWLAMEDEDGRKVLQLEHDPEYFSVIDQRARSRGIVLLFPLFDLEDTANLRVSDIWGGFHQQVLDASRRYYPDIILTGKIESPLEGIWEGSWTAYFGKEARTWGTQGSFPETVLNEGIDGIVDLLALQFVSGTSLISDDIRMRVVDMTSAEHYHRVLDYLRSLSPVTRVDVVQVSEGDIMFNITAHGGEQAVTQAINFGRLLEPVDEANKIYRLIP